jgi:uncharacterized membrane protein YgcG
MITALLLPLLVAGAPADAGRASVRAAGDDPAIQIWINNDRRFLPGDRAKVEVRAREDGYLLVLHVDPDGHLRVLFPLDPRDDDFVRGGRKYEIRGRGGRESFTADDGKGQGTVYAAISHDPYRFTDFVLGDHWDYRNLSPQRLPADPEQDLNDLVRRMVDGSFDYDILSYTVLERVVYADTYSQPYYDSYYGGCGYSYFGCGSSYYGSPYSLSVSLFFGAPRRRFYYSPFYSPFYSAVYDPFYDPFFYDPYYYRPYRPAYYRPYYNYPYSGAYYNNNYRVWNRPNTPYRFRPADGALASYRDRRYDLGRSVNTVYLPPVVRDREATNAPVRRVTDARPAAGASAGAVAGGRANVPAGQGTAARRAPERATQAGADRRTDSRLTRPNIDARRARPPEEGRSIMPDARDAAGRRDLPTEVKPLSRSEDAPRRAVERPDQGRADPQIEARPSRRTDDSPRDAGRGNQDQRPAARAEPRSAPSPRARPDPSPSERGSDRSSSPAPQPSDGGSRASSGGGERGGSGGGGSGGGGGDHGGGRRR